MNTIRRAYLGVILLLVAWVLWRWDDLGYLRNYNNEQLPALNSKPKELPPWEPGILDLHHLHVGSAVSTFIVTPDGTSILIDAGDVDVPQMRQWWKELGPPYNRLQVVDPFPNASKSLSEWIVDYLNHFWPPKDDKALDYVLLTHFHSDHFGMNRIENNNNSFSGIPVIANHFSIQKLIDRDYPNYNFPRDLSKVEDPNIDNYLQFVNITAIPHKEQFQVGSTTQIQQVHQPTKFDFSIRVVKNNNVVLLPDGTTTIIPGRILDENGNWDENAMSAALVLQYGGFRYYEGGDQEVNRNSQGEIVFDTVGPTSRIVGKVDVATLNHHGHGVTNDFARDMDPDVLVLQGWCSDQPPKKSVEILKDRIGRNARQIFATFVFPERLVDLGPSLSKLFVSTEGHVVIRVYPPPAKGSAESVQKYEVFVLDGNREIKSTHGPYSARGVEDEVDRVQK